MTFLVTEADVAATGISPDGHTRLLEVD